MNVSNLSILLLVILSCQSQKPAAQNPESTKSFDSPFGKALADFSRKDTFLLTIQTRDILDTVIFWPSSVNVTSILDVKVYNEKCVVLVYLGSFIHLYAYKKVRQKWVYVGSQFILNIERPNQEIVHKNESHILVYQNKKLIRECLIDYEKSACRLLEY
ncbi:MAG: hypothetical protein IPH31_16975 [Lewinellaceae bacterium]|nr:hypothetical protein [Lewinellaceae bacterium]